MLALINLHIGCPTGLSSQQHYIQGDHLVSLEPVQGGHKASQGQTTFITEQGITS